MGLEYFPADAAGFPDKKLTIKVPPRKPMLPLDIPFAEPEESVIPKFGDLVGGIENTYTSTVLNSPTADIKDRYVMGKELGRGHFGVVRVCEDRCSLAQYACKSIDKAHLKKREEIKELQAEIGVMEHLMGHPNVVTLRNVFEDDEAVHLVMDLCKEGDLFDYIARKRRLPEAEAAKIFRQVVLAVQYCHSRGVIHRDLKPENILFAKVPNDGHGDFSVKLADFGLAVMVQPGEEATGLAGSPFYMAPELVKRRPYGTEIDVWSLGVVLYTALSGFLPFWGKTHEQTFAAVCRGEADFFKKPWHIISPEAKSLVRKMLTMDRRRRASIDDILAHPWMLAHCPRSAPKSRPKPLMFALQNQEEEETVNFHPVPQALSAPKGRFSPPRTPSPVSSPRSVWAPKPSLSQLLPTPPGTPKMAGEYSQVTPFAAALAKPFRFLQQQHQGRLQQLDIPDQQDSSQPAFEGMLPSGGELTSPAQTTPRPSFLAEPQRAAKKAVNAQMWPLQGQQLMQGTAGQAETTVGVPKQQDEEAAQESATKNASDVSSQGDVQGECSSPRSPLDKRASTMQNVAKSVASQLSTQFRRIVS